MVLFSLLATPELHNVRNQCLAQVVVDHLPVRFVVPVADVLHDLRQPQVVVIAHLFGSEGGFSDQHGIRSTVLWLPDFEPIVEIRDPLVLQDSQVLLEDIEVLSASKNPLHIV